MNEVQARPRGPRSAVLGGATALAMLAPTGHAPVMVDTLPASIAQQSATAPALVFDGVTVVDVEQGRLLQDQRVVVVGNRIQEMGSAGKIVVPKGAQVVDAKGKYLIPGLWDLHVHPRRATQSFYPLFIANGVTGIRDAGSEVPLDTLRLWRQEILAGTRVGPTRQILSGQSIAGPSDGCQRSETIESPQTCVADEADARHYVDSMKAAGADMIKPRAVGREIYFAIAAESRRLGIPFGGHAQEETAIEVADSGALILDHMQHAMGAEGIGGLCWGAATAEQCQPVAAHLVSKGTWFVPTLVREEGAGGTYSAMVAARFGQRATEFWGGSLLHGNWLRDSTESGMSPVSTAGSAADASRAMSVMQRVGMPILAGTDAGAPVLQSMPPGFALHAELAMYVAEGLTPLNALQTATLNPAKMLHATDSLGTVAPGKLADLVLLDADPLADITNTTTVRAVVANGRYFDRTALDQLLKDVQSGQGQP